MAVTTTEKDIKADRSRFLTIPVQWRAHDEDTFEVEAPNSDIFSDDTPARSLEDSSKPEDSIESDYFNQAWDKFNGKSKNSTSINNDLELDTKEESEEFERSNSEEIKTDSPALPNVNGGLQKFASVPDPQEPKFKETVVKTVESPKKD